MGRQAGVKRAPQTTDKGQPLRKSVDALRAKVVRARFLKLLYLAAIAVAMIGWLWLLVKGLAWALGIQWGGS
jgi:hypothetical protein